MYPPGHSRASTTNLYREVGRSDGLGERSSGQCPSCFSFSPGPFPHEIPADDDEGIGLGTMWCWIHRQGEEQAILLFIDIDPSGSSQAE